MRIAFMGTPDFAVPTLDALLDAGHEVVAVYCQPARPAGRGKGMRPSPVQRRAEEAGIEVRTPVSLKGEAEQAAFAALEIDVAVVAAYGLILPEPILNAPRYGCLNVHGSLLPRWRGAAPGQRAILAGDELTGVCIMQMEKGLDTGPVMATVSTEIGRKTAGELTNELALVGAKAMIDVLARLPDVERVAQDDSKATYAPKIEKSEARLDWEAGAVQVERQVRAFNPMPGAWFAYGDERIKVLTAHIQSASPERLEDMTHPFEAGLVLDDQLAIGCAIGAIRPHMVQRGGRAVMTVQELLRGFPIPKGTKLQ